MSNPVGVIGTGNFGITIANILAKNQPVFLYGRNSSKIKEAATSGLIKGYTLHSNITLTNSIEEITSNCFLIFPVVPSKFFRSTISAFSPFLRPHHMLIHATKGLDVTVDLEEVTDIDKSMIKTMSEVILEESSVVRVGCIAGPNLAAEVAKEQPSATVLASNFDEVIQSGQEALKSSYFQVYGSKDLLGIELAGVLKNYIAIASGGLSGMGYGENSRALLIARGMAEMVYIGNALDAHPKSFLGLAGVGDLVATCSSKLSRNFSVGYNIAQGKSLKEIIETMDDEVEGIRTCRIVKGLSDHYNITAPIAQVLYRVLFNDFPIEKAIKFLMEYDVPSDVDFYESN